MTTTHDTQNSNNTNDSTENIILNYILLFFSCAFIGWVWEVLLYFIQTGTFVNRGVLHGPWLPIYGFGGLGIAFFLRRFHKHPWLVFALALIGCSLLEYLTAWYLETFKHLKWWDYTNQFCNLHGRICLLSSVTFGLCGLAIVYLLYPRMVALYNHLRLRPKKVLCFALILVFMADFVYSSDYPNTGRGITSEISQTHLEHKSPEIAQNPVYNAKYL